MSRFEAHRRDVNIFHFKRSCDFNGGQEFEQFHIIDVIVDPTKYFGCELGAQTNFDMKNERFIVNGEHDAAKLQDILDGFIRKFVLCAACENPETTLVNFWLLFHFSFSEGFEIVV